MALRRPQTHYARSGKTAIAYQVTGDGPLDLVYIPGFISHIEYEWEDPHWSRYYQRLAAFCRLIRLDKRGTGLSDRSAGIATMEERMDDIRAVMDAAGSERAAIWGGSEGGPRSLCSSPPLIPSAPPPWCCMAPMPASHELRTIPGGPPEKNY